MNDMFPCAYPENIALFLIQFRKFSNPTTRTTGGFQSVCFLKLLTVSTCCVHGYMYKKICFLTLLFMCEETYSIFVKNTTYCVDMTGFIHYIVVCFLSRRTTVSMCFVHGKIHESHSAIDVELPLSNVINLNRGRDITPHSESTKYRGFVLL